VVNYKNAPTYKIAKFIAKYLKQNLDLPRTYNINNSVHCGAKIKKLAASPTYRMVTLDVTNLYTSIPNTETLDIIITKMQDNTIWDEIRKEVHDLTKVTVIQNYFEYNDSIWQQTDGTAVGSPIASILAEIFYKK
jgi:hypothetical protein